MIIYDPHKATNFLKMRGSVFPRALWYAFIPSLLALVLKILDTEGVIDLKDLDLNRDQSVYQGFTFVLGFILVFRASQSYARYWSSARAVHQMGAEWYDGAASLIAFAHASEKPAKDINMFAHLVVRLFCILHAMALEEIAGIVDQGFPLLDIEGMDTEDLRVLSSPSSQGRKVEIVNQWIKSHILGSIKSKMLNVPPPILTRVFQQLGSGLVHYHEVLQAVIWPFPFPYAQMSFTLLVAHSVLTPLILAQNAEQPASACALTFVSVVCMKGIELIAAELENPFGNDANDLPTYEMHHEMLEDLILLTNPGTFKVPRLCSNAIMDHNQLNASAEQRYKELMRRQKYHASAATTLHWSSSSLGEEPHQQTKTERKMAWMRQHYPHSAHRIARLFGVAPPDPDHEAKSFVFGHDPIGNSGPGLESGNELQKDSEVDVVMPAESSKETKSSNTKPEKLQDPPMLDFFSDLAKSMQSFFSQQNEQIRTAHELQLRSLQEVLKQQSAMLQPLPPDKGIGSAGGNFVREPQNGNLSSRLQALPERGAAPRFCCQDVNISQADKIMPRDPLGGRV